MRGKYFACGMVAGLLLAIAVNTAPAEQINKVSPDNSGFTIQGFTTVDPSGPTALDPTVLPNNPSFAPGVPNNASAAAAVVPEPTTIAMLLLGSGCAGAVTALRRRRRG